MALPLVSMPSRPPSRQSCPPRYRVAQERGSGDLADEIATVADLIGYPQLDWQRDVTRVWSTYDEDGQWVHRRNGASVPRQAGKSVDGIVWATTLTALLGYSVLWTDHNYSTTCEMLKRFQRIFGRKPGDPWGIADFNRLVRRFNSKTAQESFELTNGGVLAFSTRTRSSALGYSFDVVFYDEAQELTGEHVQAITPTTAAGPHHNTQDVYLGTPTRAGSSATKFRELQQRWREAGIVPQANVKELWETYNLHVENFYNYIKINKELRDLDLKRNYETKVQLCEAAEALMLEPSIVTAFRKLQDLHDQWRETGPVANEYKEALWERFKEASTRINKQHQEYFEKLKEEQRHNLELKTELCVKTEELASSILTTRKEWNKASERLIEIQKVWKTIGFAPQKDNARIYERFRNACDKFFEQKRDFYQQLKAEMDHNLQLKTEICEAAESLQESEQWKKATDELIALQKRWKEIGPVARRHSDAIWKRFRSACDHFFERKAAHFSGVDAQHEENLQAKLALLAEMEAADIREGGFDLIKDFQRRWNEIGFVPLKQKDEIQKRYKQIVDNLFATLRGGQRERNLDRFRSKVSDMRNSGDKRLRFERDRLYGKVRQLESDIATLENNIGFFSRSKNAESMIREVEQKIAKAKQEMADTIEKIKLIDSQQE